jgi:hypothetical protein
MKKKQPKVPKAPKVAKVPKVAKKTSNQILSPDNINSIKNFMNEIIKPGLENLH